MNALRTPDATAQYLAPVLDVWASLNGYVVGFVGGFTRETIHEFPTLDEAFAAHASAIIAGKGVGNG